ncbi:hypothetical protein [Terracoccus sp. 273MFTsu3.1]|uniref:hypothetical protein n=1 Tax=Terracoccus sp. 273MFTsu3.1 TaxID=1172188 RepID=UPI000490E05C|nr:hypothetical protein [Terracoccus sp. 273MFTsu3.1]
MSDPHVLAPGTAPTPFTADEIRAGCPDGRTITLLVEPADGPSWQRVNRFVDPDEDGATLQRWRIGPDGHREGEVEEGRMTWLQLQGHASFPVSAVTVTPDTVELPLGTVDALRYAVDDGEGGVATFWFAPAFPGMPVRYETPAEDGGTDRTTMVRNELP